jgi:hypothetical protein
MQLMIVNILGACKENGGGRLLQLQFTPIPLTTNLFLHRNNRNSRDERSVSCPLALSQTLISAHEICLLPSGLETCSELMQCKEK